MVQIVLKRITSYIEHLQTAVTYPLCELKLDSTLLQLESKDTLLFLYLEHWHRRVANIDLKDARKGFCRAHYSLVTEVRPHIIRPDCTNIFSVNIFLMSFCLILLGVG